MTRDDLHWAGIRLLGVWVGILAFQALLTLLGSLPMFVMASRLVGSHQSPGPASTAGLPEDLSSALEARGLSTELPTAMSVVDISPELLAVAIQSLISNGLKFAGLAILAFYLIRRGAGLVRLLELRKTDSDAV
jgi:hypothetical protein